MACVLSDSLPFITYRTNDDTFVVFGRVFTSGFWGRLANESQKSHEDSCFPTRLKLSESAYFSRILIKFKPPNRVDSQIRNTIQIDALACALSSSIIILPVKTCIIFKPPNKICSQRRTKHCKFKPDDEDKCYRPQLWQFVVRHNHLRKAITNVQIARTPNIHIIAMGSRAWLSTGQLIPESCLEQKTVNSE